MSYITVHTPEIPVFTGPSIFIEKISFVYFEGIVIMSEYINP